MGLAKSLCLTALSIFAVSCDDYHTATEPDAQPVEDATRASVLCDPIENTAYITKAWSPLTCGQTHYVKIVSSFGQGEDDEVEEATNELGSVLNGDFGLPQLEYSASASNPLIEVTFIGPVGASLYKGKEVNGEIEITRTNEPSSGTEPRTYPLSQLDRVVLHELTQAVGFTPRNLNGIVVQPALTDCTTEVPLPENGDMNDSLCSHEVQSIYAAFGLRDGYDVDLTTEMSEMSFIHPEAATIEVGETKTFRVPSPPASGFAWSVSGASGVIDVFLFPRADSIVVEGEGEGTAQISATAGPSTSTVWYGDWPSSSAEVTVVDPPPPPTLTTVTISPSFAMLGKFNHAQLLTATGYDQFGTPMSGINFNWSVDPLEVWLQNVSSNQKNARGCDHFAPTSVTVTATAAGTSISGTATVNVKAGYPNPCPI